MDQENVQLGEFPGGPVVGTPHFHCRGPGFDPWWEKLRSHMLCGMAWPKKKKEKRKENVQLALLHAERGTGLGCRWSPLRRPQKFHLCKWTLWDFSQGAWGGVSLLGAPWWGAGWGEDWMGST